MDRDNTEESPLLSVDEAGSTETNPQSEPNPARLRRRKREEEDPTPPLVLTQQPPSSAGSSVAARRVQLHPLTDSDPSLDNITPVDEAKLVDPADMATIVSVGFKDTNGPNDSSNKYVGDSQGGVVELSTLITNPGMRKSESSEVLHLTLHQCARDGDAESMRRLLASLTGNVKKKINSHDDEDLSALHYAARYNHHPIVKMLVEAGARTDDVDKDGGTPLHFAARYKRMRLSQINTETNTDEGERNPLRSEIFGDMIFDNVDDTDYSNVPPAESTVDNSVILYLVDSGANVNYQDIYGCTPLHFAAMRGNEIACKELLMCKNIIIEAIDKQQMTATLR